MAKLGRANPRLKALVKAGVVPPSTAVNLVRAHGETKGTEIAETAVAIAKAEGKAKATGKHVSKAETAAGVASKVGNKNKKGADHTRQLSKTVTVTVAPAVSKTDKAGVTVSTLAGPFKLGKDLTECAIFDANGAELCEVADVGMAKAVLQLLMLGWGVLKGTPAAPAVTVAAPAVTKRVVPVPDAAAIAAAEAEAEALASAKAERQAAARARVAAQVTAEDAKRVAASKANLAAIAAMAKADVTKAKSRAKSRATVATVVAAVAKASKANGSDQATSNLTNPPRNRVAGFLLSFLECSDMLELMESKIIRNGMEVLELYRVLRAEWSHSTAIPCGHTVTGYRLVWADATPDHTRKARVWSADAVPPPRYGQKPRLLDVRDYTAANNGARAIAAFRKAR